MSGKREPLMKLTMTNLRRLLLGLGLVLAVGMAGCTATEDDDSTNTFIRVDAVEGHSTCAENYTEDPDWADSRLLRCQRQCLDPADGVSEGPESSYRRGVERRYVYPLSGDLHPQ